MLHNLVKDEEETGCYRDMILKNDALNVLFDGTCELLKSFEKKLKQKVNTSERGS